MNKTIKKELEKVRIKLPEYDDTTTKLFIPKSGIIFRFGGSYLIRVPNYILNEPDGFTLSANWNQGRKPKTNLLYAQYIKKLGKMIQFNIHGWNEQTQSIIETDYYKDFWLPEESITIIREL